MSMDYTLGDGHLKNFLATAWSPALQDCGIVWGLHCEVLVYYSQSTSESVGNLCSQVTKEMFFTSFPPGKDNNKSETPKDKEVQTKQYASVYFHHEESILSSTNLFNGINILTQEPSKFCSDEDITLPHRGSFHSILRVTLELEAHHCIF